MEINDASLTNAFLAIILVLLVSAVVTLTLLALSIYRFMRKAHFIADTGITAVHVAKARLNNRFRPQLDSGKTAGKKITNG